MTQLCRKCSFLHCFSQVASEIQAIALVDHENSDVLNMPVPPENDFTVCVLLSQILARFRTCPTLHCWFFFEDSARQVLVAEEHHGRLRGAGRVEVGADVHCFTQVDTFGKSPFRQADRQGRLLRGLPGRHGPLEDQVGRQGGMSR